ncbi:MAG: hypothetical protein FJ027_21285 [Candidatus Rokubacteria bacterium]|nr:hypothetical protein [Candidatus Rokubacteria bacterium]
MNVLALTERAALPLNCAALCLDDETLFHVTARGCPTCASEHFVLVATWIGVGADPAGG